LFFLNKFNRIFLSPFIVPFWVSYG
jgi:hypothetical protein